MMSNEHAVNIDHIKGATYHYRQACEIAAMLNRQEAGGWQYVVQGDANLEFGRIAIYDAEANFLGNF